MEIPEAEKREKGKQEIFEVILTESFPKLIADTKSWNQQAQRIPSSINNKKSNCGKSNAKRKT